MARGFSASPTTAESGACVRTALPEVAESSTADSRHAVVLKLITNDPPPESVRVVYSKQLPLLQNTTLHIQRFKYLNSHDLLSLSFNSCPASTFVFA